MLNEEKYKTTEERINGFLHFCKRRNHSCPIDCPFSSTDGGIRCHCEFNWLSREVEVEKPMPCPFCDNEYVEVEKAVAGKRVVKCICGYCSQAKESDVEAIAAHNRICKAVAAYKENEVN